MEIGGDIVNSIVVASLKQSILYHVKDAELSCHNPMEIWSEIVSFLDTLSYYSLATDYDEFMEEIQYDTLKDRIFGVQKKQDDIVSNVQLVENEDGSCIISFEASPEIIQNLASLGFRYSILREITGIRDDDEFLRIFTQAEKT